MDTPVTRRKVPFLGFVLLILASIVFGVALGVIVAAARIYLNIYLVLVFPIFMGAIAGYLISAIAKGGKVRSKVIVVFFGLLTGLIAYGSYRYGEFYFDKQQAYAAHPEVDKGVIDARIDASLQKETGQPGFIGYVMARAKEGIGIVFQSSYDTSTNTSSDFTLQGPVAYGYWGVEILVVCLLAASLAPKSISTPFCDRDNRFFTTFTVGRVPKDSADQFMTMARAADWRGASMLLDKSRSKIRYPYLEVQALKCPSCNTNPVPLFVIRKLSSRKRSQTIAFKTTLTPQQYGDFAGVPAEPVPATAQQLTY